MRGRRCCRHRHGRRRRRCASCPLNATSQKGTYFLCTILSKHETPDSVFGAVNTSCASEGDGLRLNQVCWHCCGSVAPSPGGPAAASSSIERRRATFSSHAYKHTLCIILCLAEGHDSPPCTQIKCFQHCLVSKVSKSLSLWPSGPQFGSTVDCALPVG